MIPFLGRHGKRGFFKLGGGGGGVLHKGYEKSLLQLKKTKQITKRLFSTFGQDQTKTRQKLFYDDFRDESTAASNDLGAGCEWRQFPGSNPALTTYGIGNPESNSTTLSE